MRLTLVPKRLVLVIDDEPSIVNTVTNVLQEEGYATARANTAEDALRLVHSGLTPDAVLLDLRMPGMGGLGFLLALRAQPGGRDIPVAVVTADSLLDDTTQRAVEALGARLCFKPLNIDQVLTLTAQLLSSTVTYRDDRRSLRESQPDLPY
jgi:CheY-like chemotaxis protein